MPSSLDLGEKGAWPPIRGRAGPSAAAGGAKPQVNAGGERGLVRSTWGHAGSRDALPPRDGVEERDGGSCLRNMVKRETEGGSWLRDGQRDEHQTLVHVYIHEHRCRPSLAYWALGL